jgi:dihydropyrimidine dehydrogenase (NAD+) subunit PreA
MHRGFPIIRDLVDGLSQYLDDQGLADLAALRGRALPRVKRWEDLNLNYRVIASVNKERCIGCGLCYLACEDGAHQAIGAKRDGRGRTQVTILEDKCVGCNLCSLVCPVSDCITMKRVDDFGDKVVTWRDYSAAPQKYPHIRSNRHDE